MTLEELEKIFVSLNQSKVRYLVAGGIAVNIHGYQRATADLDLVIQLTRDNVLIALKALKSLGYQSLLPVSEEDFAEENIRDSWKRDKNMQVFSMYSSLLPGTTIDIFVTYPFKFDQEYDQAYSASINDVITIPVVTLKTLIEMKKEAGRHRDLDDIEHLKMLNDEGKN